MLENVKCKWTCAGAWMGGVCVGPRIKAHIGCKWNGNVEMCVWVILLPFLRAFKQRGCMFMYFAHESAPYCQHQHKSDVSLAPALLLCIHLAAVPLLNGHCGCCLWIFGTMSGQIKPGVAKQSPINHTLALNYSGITDHTEPKIP